MPAPAAKHSEGHEPAPIGELDRVKLIRTVTDKDRRLSPGLKGTVVLCYATAYEVEFDTIDDDFFQIPAEDLEKI